MDLRGCDRQIRGSALQCLAARIKLMTDDRLCGLCSDCHLYENTALGTVAIASTVAHGRCLHIALKITTHTNTHTHSHIQTQFFSKANTRCVLSMDLQLAEASYFAFRKCKQQAKRNATKTTFLPNTKGSVAHRQKASCCSQDMPR